LETARKLFGSKYNMASKEFQEAMNEVMFVFADCRSVINAMQEFWETLQTPQQSRAPSIADEKLVKLMKAVCLEVGVKYKDLPDAYFLRFLSVPNNALSPR
jgi:ABC-type dipeptide/oligopeptide/nickel transport system ATPase subunit